MDDDINQPLTFLALEPSTITLLKFGSINITTLLYKVNNSEWNDYVLNTTITLNTGDCVQFLNTNNTLSTSNNNFVNFQMTGKIQAYNNIQSLINFRSDAPDYCYRKLFQNCLSLVRAPLLPAETVGQYSYGSTFGKTNVSNVLKMSAKTLGQYACYYMMEQTPIEKAPEIQVTSVSNYGFSYMFINCSQLKTPPSQLLPTIASKYCCSNMFNGCTSLQTVPKLNFTQLNIQCFNLMFNGCRSLTQVPKDYLPITTLYDTCYGSMFCGCRNLLKAPELPATTLSHGCYNSMFAYCVNLTEITVKFTEWVSNCTNYWVTDVNTNGTFICPNELEIIRDSSHIPSNWNIYHPIF